MQSQRQYTKETRRGKNWNILSSHLENIKIDFYRAQRNTHTHRVEHPRQMNRGATLALVYSFDCNCDNYSCCRVFSSRHFVRSSNMRTSSQCFAMRPFLPAAEPWVWSSEALMIHSICVANISRITGSPNLLELNLDMWIIRCNESGSSCSWTIQNDKWSP